MYQREIEKARQLLEAIEKAIAREEEKKNPLDDRLDALEEALRSMCEVTDALKEAAKK